MELTSLPRELVSEVLGRLDRKSLRQTSLVSSDLRSIVVFHHSSRAFDPVIGVELHCNQRQWTIRTSCRKCASHDTPKREKKVKEKVFQDDQESITTTLDAVFAHLCTVLRIPARSFDLTILDAGSAELVHFRDLFKNLNGDSSTATAKSPRIRCLCVRTVRGTDESALRELLTMIDKPKLLYLHVWQLSSLRWDSKALRTARTVCLRSDVFAPLPEHLNIRPYTGTDEDMKESAEQKIEEVAGGIEYVIEELDNLCGHRHLFQLNRLPSRGWDKYRIPLKEENDQQRQPYNAIKFHIRQSNEGGAKHRNFVVELMEEDIVN